MVTRSAETPANNGAESSVNGNKTDNVEAQLARLQLECDRLRQQLCETESDRDNYRRALCRLLAKDVSESERQDLEERARETFAEGGIRLRDIIEQCERREVS